MATALERAEALKAARRGELKAAEDERRRADEEWARRADAAFARALGDWLREKGAEWLLEFHADTEKPNDTERKAVFRIPGHAPLTVAFSGGAEWFHAINYSAGFWWVKGTGYMRLDNALIVAEATADADPQAEGS